jgi:hypothetical protein
MAALPDTGWESIGKAFGKPVGVLFNQMIDEINGYRITGRVYQYRTDPLTNEAVDFFVNMGTVRDKHTNTVAVGFPKQVPVFSPTTLTRWAMVFVEPFAVPDVAFDTVQAVAINGDVFFAVSPQFIHY